MTRCAKEPFFKMKSMRTLKNFLLIPIFWLTSSTVAAELDKKTVADCARERFIQQAQDLYAKQVPALGLLLGQQIVDPAVLADHLKKTTESLKKVEITIKTIDKFIDTGDGIYEFKASGVAKFPKGTAADGASSSTFVVQGSASQPNGTWVCEDMQLFQ